MSNLTETDGLVWKVHLSPDIEYPYLSTIELVIGNFPSKTYMNHHFLDFWGITISLRFLGGSHGMFLMARRERRGR